MLSSLSQTNPAEMLNNATSPKFAEELFMQTTKSIPEIGKKEFTLRRTDTVHIDKVTSSTPANQILNPSQRSTKNL